MVIVKDRNASVRSAIKSNTELYQTTNMNYNLKRLLGNYDPQLLRIRQQITWTAVNAMAQSGEYDQIKGYVKRQMAQQLATQIPLIYTETPLPDVLQLDAEIYALTRAQLLKLAFDCYGLGLDDAKVMPNFSNF